MMGGLFFLGFGQGYGFFAISRTAVCKETKLNNFKES